MPTPAAKPKKPAIAVISPPPSLKNARHGQPKNTSAPIIAKTPKKKLENVAVEFFGANSFVQKRLAKKPPSTSPMSSGRRYCSVWTLWKPNAPLVSRRKQAAQMPILAGFPAYAKKAATMPSTAPEMIKYRVVIESPLFSVNQPDFSPKSIAEIC